MGKARPGTTCRPLEKSIAARRFKPISPQDVEARVTALACSAPPEGYSRWSLRLLEKHVELTEDIPNLDHSTIGRPANGTKAFGPPAPSLSPEPAAAITADTSALGGRLCGSEALLQELVQVGLRALLVLVQRVHELGREDLLRARVHLLLAG